MPKEKYLVAFDVQNDGSGYDALAAKEKFKKGETIGIQEPLTGFKGQVYLGKVCELEAESKEEAIKIAAEAYGSRGGHGVAALASNAEWKAV